MSRRSSRRAVVESEGGLGGTEAEEGRGGEAALGPGGGGVNDLGAELGESLEVGVGQRVARGGNRLGECLGVHGREFDRGIEKSKVLFGGVMRDCATQRNEACSGGWEFEFCGSGRGALSYILCVT